MVSRAVLSLVLVGAMSPVVYGQAKTMLVEPPAPLLPQEFGKWVKETVGFEDSVPGETTVLTEDGLKRSERGVYHLAANPASTITGLLRGLDSTRLIFE